MVVNSLNCPIEDVRDDAMKDTSEDPMQPINVRRYPALRA